MYCCPSTFSLTSCGRDGVFKEKLPVQCLMTTFSLISSPSLLHAICYVHFYTIFVKKMSDGLWGTPHITYRGRVEIGGVYSWSVHHNYVRDGWANFSIMDGMYARKWQLPLCVYSVEDTIKREVGRGAIWVSTGCYILLRGERVEGAT